MQQLAFLGRPCLQVPRRNRWVRVHSCSQVGVSVKERTYRGVGALEAESVTAVTCEHSLCLDDSLSPFLAGAVNSNAIAVIVQLGDWRRRCVPCMNVRIFFIGKGSPP